MSQLIECVPNFSAGRDPRVIEAIARDIASTPGVRLLDVDPEHDTNRCVMTFFGPPESVVEAATRGALAAARLIDMRVHRGSHPRMGAADVIPFVPWSGSMAMAELCARECASNLQRLGLGGWFYGFNGRSAHQCRRGQFEGLSEREDCDFGQPHPTAGATAVGARGVLIAFNVNLRGTLAQARGIARRLRESSGGLPGVRALGWESPSYGCVQVTTNLVDWRGGTSPHELFEAVRAEARQLGTDTAGCELVGMIPIAALEQAGRFYSGAEDRLLQVAVHELGLRSVKPFLVAQKVIEVALEA